MYPLNKKYLALNLNANVIMLKTTISDHLFSFQKCHSSTDVVFSYDAVRWVVSSWHVWFDTPQNYNKKRITSVTQICNLQFPFMCIFFFVLWVSNSPCLNEEQLVVEQTAHWVKEHWENHLFQKQMLLLL